MLLLCVYVCVFVYFSTGEPRMESGKQTRMVYEYRHRIHQIMYNCVLYYMNWKSNIRNHIVQWLLLSSVFNHVHHTHKTQNTTVHSDSRTPFFSSFHPFLFATILSCSCSPLSFSFSFSFFSFFFEKKNSFFPIFDMHSALDCMKRVHFTV